MSPLEHASFFSCEGYNASLCLKRVGSVTDRYENDVCNKNRAKKMKLVHDIVVKCMICKNHDDN